MQRLVLPNECVVDGGGRRRACRIRARPRPGPSPGGGNRQAPQYRQPTGCPDDAFASTATTRTVGRKHRDWPVRGPKLSYPAGRSRTQQPPPHLAPQLNVVPRDPPRRRARGADHRIAPGQPDHLRDPMPGRERWVGPLQHRHRRPWSSFDPVRHLSHPLLDRRHQSATGSEMSGFSRTHGPNNALIRPKPSAPPVGFEPTTQGLGNLCSIP